MPSACNIHMAPRWKTPQYTASPAQITCRIMGLEVAWAYHGLSTETGHAAGRVPQIPLGGP